MRNTSRGLSAEAIHDLIWRYGAAYPRVLRYLDADSATPAAITATSLAESSPSSLRGEGRAEGLSRDGDEVQVRDKPGDALMEAQVRHGVREEMAYKLTDVIFRRTTLGIAGDPGEACLRTCAAIMAKELGWDAKRMQREVEEVRAVFSTWS
jgi:glycerol-3-phosphate dehydrogenase